MMDSIADKAGIIEALHSQFENFIQSSNAENPHFQTVRNKAWESFSKTGFPSTKNEEYKYTPLARFLEKELNINTVSNIFPNDVDYTQYFLDVADANVLVFVNGIFHKDISKIVSPESEIIIKELNEAYNENPDLINEHFAQYADYNEDPFIALNTAFAKNGIFIQVKDNIILDKPVFFYYISDTSKGQVMSFPRNLILAGKNSQLQFADFYVSAGGDTSFNNIVTEVRVNANAQVQYYKIQQEDDQAVHVGTTQVHQEDDSTFSATTISLSGRLIRNNLNIAIDGKGCTANMFGLYMPEGKQHVDNHTVVDHKKPHSYSNELYKGLLGGKSTGVFNGKIFVRQDAQKTNAFQSNKNILLSPDATMNTKPQLEIWADDVKCSHGATTGQMDEEQLFYLRARGISKESAQAMLLYAFAKDVLENIQIEALKTSLDNILAKRLDQQF